MEKLGQYNQALKQWFFKDVLNNEGFLASIGTMSQGVLTGDAIGFLPTAGYEDAKTASCGPTYTAQSISGDDKWTIKDLGIYKSWCADDIAAELKRAKALYALSEDKTMVKVFQRLMGESLANSAFCLGMFGDTTSSNSNIAHVDGVIKQVMTMVGTATGRHTSIATNTKAALKVAGVASDYMLSLIEDADPVLRGASDAEIICTQATYDALNRDMMLNKGLNLDTQMNELYGGMKETKWQGFRLVVTPAADKVIASVTGNPLASVGPHFALFTTKSNIMFGSSCNDEAGVGTVKIWDDEKEDRTFAKVKYSLGVKVADVDLVQALY